MLITPGVLRRAARAGRHPAADHVPGHRVPRAVGLLHRRPQQPPPVLPLLRVAGDVERHPDRLRGGRRRVRAPPRWASPTRWPGAWWSARSLEVAIQVPAVRGLDPRRALSLDSARPTCRTCSAASSPWWSAAASIQLLTYVDLFLASLLAVGGVSALTYGQVLYLLPISLFGMAVAAAELPELSRLGRPAAEAIRERLHTGHRAHHLLRRHHRRRCTCSRATSSWALLLQRGEFTAADTQLVWYVVGRLRPRAARHHPLAAAPERPLRPRPAQARGAHRRLPRRPGRPARRLLHVPARSASPSSTAPSRRSGRSGFRPLPDSLRLLEDGPPRLGVVGLALGAALSSWVEYRLLKGALEWRIGALPRLGHDARWCLIAAAGLRRPGRRAAVAPPTTCPSSSRPRWSSRARGRRVPRHHRVDAGARGHRSSSAGSRQVLPGGRAGQR